jgi:hypothetical protein
MRTNNSIRTEKENGGVTKRGNLELGDLVSRMVADQSILFKPAAHKVVRRDGISNAMLVQAARRWYRW